MSGPSSTVHLRVCGAGPSANGPVKYVYGSPLRVRSRCAQGDLELVHAWFTSASAERICRYTRSASTTTVHLRIIRAIVSNMNTARDMDGSPPHVRSGPLVVDEDRIDDRFTSACAERATGRCPWSRR